MTGASFSVPLNQGMGRYAQDLIIKPRYLMTAGAYLTIINDYAPHIVNCRGLIDYILYPTT